MANSYSPDELAKRIFYLSVAAIATYIADVFIFIL